MIFEIDTEHAINTDYIIDIRHCDGGYNNATNDRNRIIKISLSNGEVIRKEFNCYNAFDKANEFYKNIVAAWENGLLNKINT